MLLRLPALLFLLLLAGCGMPESVQRAEAFIGEFHARLAERDFDTIWREAHSQFQRGTPAAAWRRFRHVHERLGAPRAFTVDQWAVATSTSEGTRVAVTTDTRFANGRAREAFTLLEAETGLRLARYDILDIRIDEAGEQAI